VEWYIRRPGRLRTLLVFFLVLVHIHLDVLRGSMRAPPADGSHSAGGYDRCGTRSMTLRVCPEKLVGPLSLGGLALISEGGTELGSGGAAERSGHRSDRIGDGGCSGIV